MVMMISVENAFWRETGLSSDTADGKLGTWSGSGQPGTSGERRAREARVTGTFFTLSKSVQGGMKPAQMKNLSSCWR